MPESSERHDAGAASRREIRFPAYRRDLDAGFLRAGDRRNARRPTTWAVLRYLAERPGVLVSTDELLDAVWSGVMVTETTLSKSIGEIREALRDEVRRPRYVETVHRRGFRFVPTMAAPAPVEARSPSGAPDAARSPDVAEGLDTTDLRMARALLEEIGA